MQTQINIPAQSMWRVVPEDEIAKTFQENKPKLLDTLSNEIRVKHYSRETEESYIYTYKNKGIFRAKILNSKFIDYYFIINDLLTNNSRLWY